MNKSRDELNEMFDYPLWDRFLESKHCTIVTGHRMVRRTWAERLFTLPWTPLVATKIEMVHAPDPKVYELSPGVFIGHPATIAAVRRALGK